MILALVVAALLVATVLDAPVTYAGPTVPHWLASLCDDRTDDVTASWFAVLVDHDAYGVAMPRPTARVVVDRVPTAPTTIAHPVFRLRGPPAPVSR